MSRKENSNLYEWAYRTGKLLYEALARRYGSPERAKDQLRVFLLNLRSEQIPERFRKQLVDYIVSIASMDRGLQISFPRKVKIEASWTIDEFYRYSTSIIAGFFDAIFGSEREEIKEKIGGEEHAT